MTKALEKTQGPVLPDELKEVAGLAKVFIASGYFKDIGDISKGVVKIMAGRELGIGAFASVNGINLISGKLSLSASLQGALLKKSGRYNYKITDHSDEHCSIEFYAVNPAGEHKLGSSTFTLRDAELAGLLRNEVWKKYPKNMLFARALTNGIRFHCPDVLNGNAVYDEYEATLIKNPDPEKGVIKATVIEANPIGTKDESRGWFRDRAIGFNNDNKVEFAELPSAYIVGTEEALHLLEQSILKGREVKCHFDGEVIQTVEIIQEQQGKTENDIPL